MGQVADEVVSPGQLGRRHAFLVRGLQPPVPDVFQHAGGEQHRILQHDAQGFPQGRLPDLFQRDAVVRDGPRGNIIEPVQQVRDGGLAGAGGPHQGDLLAGQGVDVDVVEDGLAGFISEIHMDEVHFPGEGPQLGLARLLRNGPGPVVHALSLFPGQGLQGYRAPVLFGLFVQQVKDPLGPGHAQDDGVDLGRDHLDVRGELPAHAQEGDHHRQAEGQPGHGQVGHLMFQEKAPGTGHDDINDVTDIIQDGHQRIGILVGLIGSLEQLLVHPVEFLPGLLFVVEYLDDLAPVDAFFHEALAGRQGVLLLHEIRGAAAPHLPGDDDGPQGATHHHQAHPQAVVQHDGHQGGQGHRRDAQLGERLGDHLPQGIHIVGEIAHHIPPLVPVEIPQGQAFQVAEQLFPELGQAALVQHSQQLVVGHIGHQGDDVQKSQDPHVAEDLALYVGPPQAQVPGLLQGVHHLLHEHGGQGQDAGVHQNQHQNGGQQSGIEPPQGA